MKGRTMTNPVIERNKATVAKFLAGTHSANIDDVEVIDEVVVPHIVCHGFPGFPNGEFFDRESYKAFFRVFRESFSDMSFETTRLIATEDFVSAHWEIWATHTGNFQRIPPNGARVVFDGVALYRMEDGKIAETWLRINEPLLASQLSKGAAKAA
jgi:predicted ester cyclase